jgi:predicted nucleic acid-binding protein
MSRVVLDSSYAMALTLPDETPPASSADVLARALVAPHIFPLEVANAALNTIRRRRYRPDEADQVCEVIEALGIEVMAPPDVGPRHHVRMALAHGLSAYDALYLDLALAQRCPLATCDVTLGAAARKAGLEVLS